MTRRPAHCPDCGSGFDAEHTLCLPGCGYCGKCCICRDDSPPLITIDTEKREVMTQRINVTVPRDALREIVVMAHTQAVSASYGDIGEPATIMAIGAREAIIATLAVMLGDASGARRAVAAYLRGNLGSGEYGAGEMTDHIMRLGDMS